MSMAFFSGILSAEQSDLNHDIGFRLDADRRSLGIDISRCHDFNVRIVFADIPGDTVDEVEQCAGVTFILFDQRKTFLALAVGAVIVLHDAVNFRTASGWMSFCINGNKFF